MKKRKKSPCKVRGSVMTTKGQKIQRGTWREEDWRRGHRSWLVVGGQTSCSELSRNNMAREFRGGFQTSWKVKKREEQAKWGNYGWGQVNLMAAGEQRAIQCWHFTKQIRGEDRDRARRPHVWKLCHPCISIKKALGTCPLTVRIPTPDTWSV